MVESQLNIKSETNNYERITKGGTSDKDDHRKGQMCYGHEEKEIIVLRRMVAGPVTARTTTR